MITKDTVLIAIDSRDGSLVIGKEYPIVNDLGNFISIQNEINKKDWFEKVNGIIYYAKYFTIKESKKKPHMVTLWSIDELATGTNKNEILLNTSLNTELMIRVNDNKTTISFPFGNKFDVIDGRIIIHEK
jgi:hypothetical protein